MHARCFASLLLSIAFLSLNVVGAIDDSSFSGRLSPLPADAYEARTMQGQGSVSASLEGMTLTIKGKFEGPKSPTTGAAIRPAVPGLPRAFQFSPSCNQTASGLNEGKATLTVGKVEHLKRGWFYLQINTEKNPDGH